MALTKKLNSQGQVLAPVSVHRSLLLPDRQIRQKCSGSGGPLRAIAVYRVCQNGQKIGITTSTTASTTRVSGMPTLV
jgi:hypothetical protein